DVAADPVLLAAVEREGAGWYLDELHRLGKLAGGEEAQRWGEEANRYPPVLRTHDRYGNRIDEVDFHPAWHALLDTAVGAGLAGMGMTEKQGGSDVRANTTTATAGGDGTWLLRGHKWFTSAPMSDVFLVLAQAPAGLSCFLVPRVLPDGTRNVFRIQRLKDKLGNRSNASAEPEFDGTVGWLVGPEGRGVATIIQMVALTRLDCGIGSAAGMRAALAQAAHHCRHRRAVGARLVEQPPMRNVRADLALESEAALSLAVRVAGAVDRSERAFGRLATAVVKYWICKRQPAFIAEALECLGGNGYVEESGMPRRYREAPLNGIWEGS